MPLDALFLGRLYALLNPPLCSQERLATSAGLSGMAAGIAIGIVGDAGVRASAQQPKLYVGMVLILIFAEALGLYGLIVGLILTSKTAPCQ